MLGVAEGTRPQTRDEKFFIPVPAHGLQSMSMAYLVTEKTPMVWRGPMVSGALQQLLTQTLWEDLDYLIIDMIVENMAMHICSNCGHVEHIFGEGGGAQLATDYDVNLLESLPLDLSIRTQADGGEPTVVAEPDGEITAHYQLLARRTAAALALRGADSGPSISMQ